MPRQNTALMAFNRGIVSRLGLARIDLEKLQLSAETQTNWMPRVLGSMMLRPGLGYLGTTYLNRKSLFVPFVYSFEDTALLEFTASGIRFWINDELLTYPVVTAAISNWNFATDLTDWSEEDETGGVSDWANNYLRLMSDGVGEARRRQEVTINETSVEHLVSVFVTIGPVILRAGSSAGGSEYFEYSLGAGVHTLSVTPTGNLHLELASKQPYSVLVNAILMEDGGILTLPTSFTENDLENIRWAQSADVFYISCDGFQQTKIERRSTRSWSFVDYAPNDGPFKTINVGTTTITPSATICDTTTGTITLTASAPLFKSGHAGSLFKITSAGQVSAFDATAENEFTDSIEVTGTGTFREFGITIIGTWVATVTLQRSVDNSTWSDVTTYTTVQGTTYSDGFDNQIIYYRLGVKTGDFTSGSVEMHLTYSGGAKTGIARVIVVTNSTTAVAIVLSPLGGITATDAWYESEWSAESGFPNAVAIFEGRLWFGGRSKVWGSSADNYESFDEEEVGDAAAIKRVIDASAVDVINWLLPLKRLIVGTASAEIPIRSSSFDEPLTPSNINLKDCSTHGSANVVPLKIDSRGVYVHKSKSRLFEIAYKTSQIDYQNDYSPEDLTLLIPDLCSVGIVDLAVQRMPDTRIHCVLSDGTVAILITDPIENVRCWVTFETEGEVEQAVVLPGEVEDQVYYVVKRTINSTVYRHLEKWALESEAVGGATNKIADSFLYFAGPITTVTLSHLEGEEVVAWGNSKYLGTYTVSGGTITLSESATGVCVGLGYTADYKTSKLAFAAGMGTALNQRKKVSQLGVVLEDTHPQGLMYGPDFDRLDGLPLNEDYANVDQDTIRNYDKETFEFDGMWDTDSRVCLRAEAPKPCTLLAMVVGVTTHDKA